MKHPEDHNIIDLYIECLDLEWTLKDYLVSTPLAKDWDIFQQIRLVKAPSHLVLNTYRDGTPTAPLGNILKYVTTFIVKVIFLISNLLF